MNRLLFATYSADDVTAYRRWAERLGCGLEIHTFADPTILSVDGPLPCLLERYETALAGFKGPLGFHGAFFDMVSASLDPEIVALTLRRYRQNLEIAHRLGGRYIVFHANYMGGANFKLVDYRQGWRQRQIDFWSEFVEEAAKRDIYVLIENMWADTPEILGEILDAVDHPYFRACLDIGHAALFSAHSLTAWIDTLAPHLYCCHLNNHDGRRDRHWSLGTGVIAYRPILEYLDLLAVPPLLTLEMPDRETIASSLQFLNVELLF